MTRHTVCGSHTRTLVFETDEEYLAYQRDIADIDRQYHAWLRAKYGYWAPNQNKYVKTREELNPQDLAAGAG